MKIIDTNNKERNVKYIKKFIDSERDSISGEMISKDYVEVEIIGNSMNWKQWYPFDDFIKFNPGIKI